METCQSKNRGMVTEETGSCWGRRTLLMTKEWTDVHPPEDVLHLSGLKTPEIWLEPFLRAAVVRLLMLPGFCHKLEQVRSDLSSQNVTTLEGTVLSSATYCFQLCLLILIWKRCSFNVWQHFKERAHKWLKKITQWQLVERVGTEAERRTETAWNKRVRHQAKCCLISAALRVIHR